jgi:hypothetical protein
VTEYVIVNFYENRYYISMNFYPYEGDLMGLPADKNHLVFRWADDRCKILFSVCKLGMGASCHFASDKRGLRWLKQAIDEFCGYCFIAFEWCTMILAKTGKYSIGRLISKCGFEKVAIHNGIVAYARCKP